MMIRREKVMSAMRRESGVMIKIWCIIVSSLLIYGCESTYKSNPYQVPESKLETGQNIYVALSEDGAYEDIRYPGSGRQTASAINFAVSPYAKVVEQGTEVMPIDAVLFYARASGFDYVIEPLITNWEDRATEWSGISDKLSLKVTVWSVETQSPVSATTVNASSQWATFGGDHPQDLLPGAVTPYIDSLF